MILPNFLFSFTLIILSFHSFALVDYSEPEGPRSPRRFLEKPRVQKLSAKRIPSKKSSGPSGMFNMSSLYHSQKVETELGNKDAQILELRGEFQTAYNLFLDARFDMIQSSDSALAKEPGWQKGNGQLIFGLNWLRFGKKEEMATIDFIGGARFSSSSELGSSRIDKILGVNTVKRFHQLAIGLGYEVHLTGNPDRESELAIGNVQLMKGSVGWVVSNDIRFAVEGATVSIGEREGDNSLQNEVKYSYVSPQLSLGLGPSVSVNMGATFRTRRPKLDEDLASARLWNLPGLYGNSLFAGLEFAI